MKKIITVLLSVLLIAGLFTGCNGESVEELFRGSTPAPTPTPTPTPTPEPTPVETVVISFDANGGTVIGAIDSKTVEKGSEVNLPDITGAFEAPYGYQFASCWNTKADGSGTSYNVATPTYTFESNVTLYAQWNPVPFRFVAQGNGTVRFNYADEDGSSKDAADYPVYLEYSKTGNDGDWDDYTWSVDGGLEISLNTEEELYFRAKAPNTGFFNTSDDNYYRFVIGGDGKVAAKGNIMYLLDPTGGSEVVPNHAFYFLFDKCENLISAPELPAKTLGEGCYEGMFFYTGLTTAPVLPAETLASKCYKQMFSGCTSLVNAPTLPAESLADNCYRNMFYNCSSLLTAPQLSATNLAPNCYEWMFAACTSLVNAPHLPAVDLVDKCYASMFFYCSNLTSISVAFTDWNESNNATQFWLEDASATGTFICPTTLDTTNRDMNHVPSGWDINP